MTAETYRKLTSGDVLDSKYRIIRILGEGGMGSVYLAEHVMLGEEVAIKTVHPPLLTSPGIVQRFVNEARAAAKLKTEHVAKVIDVGLSPEVGPFIVMEVLQGENVADLIDRRQTPISPREAADIVLPALEALALAHAAGIVHRDLKPSNLFLAKAPRGRTTTVKILDFGIAKATVAQPMDAAVTSTQAMMGSPLYMAPEQAKSARRAEARSDLWSMGVVLYELCTRQVPFTGETLGEVIAAIIGDPPRPMRSFVPDLPDAFVSLVEKRLLAKDTKDRIGSALELAEALAPFATPALATQYVERVRDATDVKTSERFAETVEVPGSVAAVRATPAAPAASEPVVVRTHEPMSPIEAMKAQTHLEATGAVQTPTSSSSTTKVVLGFAVLALLGVALTAVAMTRTKPNKEAPVAAAHTTDAPPTVATSLPAASSAPAELVASAAPAVTETKPDAKPATPAAKAAAARAPKASAAVTASAPAATVAAPVNSSGLSNSRQSW